VAAVAGDLVDCETMYAAKALLRKLGSTRLEGRQTGLKYDCSSLSAVNFNTTIAGLERADVILLVGTNLRWEAPLVNTRVRKAIKRGAKVFAIGPEIDLTYKAQWLGTDLGILAKLPKDLSDALRSAERPVLILGGGALKIDGVHGAALALAETFKLVRADDTGSWNGFNVLHMAAARMGGLMLGYAQPDGISALVGTKLVFALGADEVDWSAFGSSFKVYIGHHGDAGAHAADVILPGATYAEKAGTYVNLEGRVQMAERAVFPPGDAREDWAILRALSDVLGACLPFDSFDGLRAAMAGELPALGVEGLADYGWSAPKLPAEPKGEMASYPIKDFYLTNAICRASPTMAACSREIVHGESEMLEAAE
jgi:NADH-quinone oxidoreductase subunit G